MVVLVAEGTRDERAKDSAKRKEEFMHKASRRVARELPGSPHKDLSNLGRFSVSSDGGVCSAAEFVLETRERHRSDLSGTDTTTAKDPKESSKVDLPPGNFRPAGQTGLDQF